MIRDMMSGTKPFSQDEIDQLGGQRGNEFSKGMRSGTLGMRGQFSNALGAGAEALGMRDVAQGQYADADALGARAGASAPRVTSFRDIGAPGGQGRLRDTGDFVAGLLGGLVPSAAVGVGAGLLAPASLGVAGAIGAGALAYTPFETGDTVGRMREAGLPVEPGQALATGAGAAALQSIVPGMVAGKLSGRMGAGAGAAPLTAGRAGRALVAGFGLESATEAGGEAIKQVGGSGKTLDTLDMDRILDSAVAGAVGGTALSGVGLAGQYAHQKAGAVSQGLTSAKDAATGLVDRAKGTAKDAAGAVGGAVDSATAPVAAKLDDMDIGGTLHRMYDDGKAKAKGVLDKIAGGEDIVGDAKAFAGAQGDKLKGMLAGDDNERVNAVRGYADELAKNNLTPEQQATVQAWMDNPTDNAKQMAVAGLKKSQDAFKTGTAQVQRFYDNVMARVKAKAAGTQTGPKKSEVDSGMRDAVMREVVPVLAEVRPELLDMGRGEEALQLQRKLSDALVGAMKEMAEGKKPSSDTIVAMIDLFGPAAERVMTATARAMGEAPNSKAWAGILSTVEAAQRSESVTQTQRKLLRPELQKVVSDGELRVEAELLAKFRDDTKPIAGPNADPRAVLRDRDVRQALEKRYGNKTDAVLAAVEKGRRAEENQLEKVRVKVDDDGNEIGEEGTGLTEGGMEAPSMVYYGGGAKGKDMMLHPDYDETTSSFGAASTQKLAKVKGKNPNIESRFITASEMGFDHPIVKAWRAELVKRANAVGLDGERYADQELDKYVTVAHERSASPQKLSADELGPMLLDAKKFGASPSRIDTVGKGEEGNVILDAVKITKSMEARFKDEYTADDSKSVLLRKSRMFSEGVAAVQDHLGVSFTVPDDTVVTSINGRKYTWGELRKTDRRTANDKMDDKVTQGLTEMRKAYKTADPADRQQLAEDAAELTNTRNWRRDAELTADDAREQGLDLQGFEGTIERGLNRRITPSRRGSEDLQTGEVTPDVLGFSERSGTQSARQQRINELTGNYSALAVKMEDGTATKSERVQATAIRREIETLNASPESQMGSGRTEIDPFGPTQDALRGKEDGPGVGINSDGGGRNTSRAAVPKELMAVQRVAEKLRASSSAPAKRLGAKLDTLIELDRQVVKGKIKGEVDVAPKGGPTAPGPMMTFGGRAAMTQADHNALLSVGEMTKPSEMAGVINRLTEKYVSNEQSSNPSSMPDIPPMGEPPSPKALAAKKAALSKEAASGDPALLRELSTSSDSKGLQRAVQHLNSGKVDANTAAAIDAANARLGELMRDADTAYGMGIKKYSLMGAQQPAAYIVENDGVFEIHDGVTGEWVSFDHRLEDDITGGYKTRADAEQALTDQANKTKKASLHKTAPGGQSTQADRKEVLDYIIRTHGSTVQVAWAKLLHAGEFERVVTPNAPNAPTKDIIRLSVHAMNPLSPAYHESLHALFAKLGDLKRGDIMDVLNRASESAPVMNQMRKLLKNEPDALEQLADPEERSAYMYQFWASGQLTVGPETQTVFGRIAEFIRSVLSTWSNDQRALHILEYFHSGDFKNDFNKPFAGDVIRRKAMEPGRNTAIEAVKKATQPFVEMGEALAVAGGQRLRDTGVPALRELADAMKLHGTFEGDDPGFLPAARAKRAQVMNELGAKLRGFSPESIDAALESLQSKSNNPIKALADQTARGDAFTAKVHVRKMLDDMYQYMTANGVKVNDLGVGKDYFPRLYNTGFIAANQKEFLAVLTKHDVKNPENVMKKLMVGEGAEFTVETELPGMQHLKPRDLAFVPDDELAPFMRKNLFEILNGYVTQASRRAEWADRFGDKGQRITALLARADREGATPGQIASAHKFVRAVDGTLGDTINPEARRLMGNMIVYQNIRLLPLAIFSSVIDPMGIAVRGGTAGEAFTAFKRGVKETVKNFKKTATDDDATKLAASLGVIDDSSLVHALGSLYSQGMVGDTGRKINDTFFRYNLMEQYTTSVRVSAMEASIAFLGRHADGTASKHSKRWLAELGLKPGDIQLDADGRAKVTQGEGLTLDQAAAMKTAINRWVDGAVLRPDAVDKPVWMSDPHFALFAHLKQFIFSFQETILKRVVHEFSNGNYAPAMALSSYVPMMIAADLIKGLIQGGGEQPEWKDNWTLSDYLMSGIERAGLYGTGQFAVDALQDVQRGGSGIGALLGPTVEQLTDAVRVIGGRAEFGAFALKSMPANALYADALRGEAAETQAFDE